MKFKLLSVMLLLASTITFGQTNGKLWNATSKNNNLAALDARVQLPEKHLFTLDLQVIRATLSGAQNRFTSQKATTVLAIPNADGILENYRVYENPIMEQDLALRYPEIKSYVGVGITNPASRVYFSVTPLGFRSMVLCPDKPAEFIEPISADYSTYSVYRKADKIQNLSTFECSVIDKAINSTGINTDLLRPNADDSTLRTFRLAMSCTGEYTAYFGGTKAQALAAITNSITRCNGVFEMDFGVRMVLIANTDAVIYTSASSDPYSPASSLSNWNSQLQSTLTSVIGEANYDVGHLFGATGGGGNAGCIGCVCVNGSKGSGYTSPADGIPYGDNFDIDYVAHELGHQFGANHTFTHSTESGTGAQMEPGSGSTIMGYAGITAKDVQPHSDAYFHAISIQQVTNNIKNKTCQTNTATGNAVPTANAGLDYTIPKSTPFMLTGSGTDANGDTLTYCWEQMNLGTSTTSTPSATATAGPTFRSYSPSTNPTRTFPRMQSVLAGATTTTGTEIPVEVLSSVARTLNFRLTVRDNRAGGSANNSDDAIITVNGTAGPFTVSSPNTAVSYVGGSTQTVTWNVAGTTANGVNCANVDILLSTDGGTNWTTILAATPNDGTQAVTIPNTPSTTCRIMVKGTNHIFFDVSNTNFTITAGSAPDTTAPTAPTLSASGTTQTGTNLSWSGATDNVGVTGYDVYRGATLLGSTAATTYAVTGLTPSTAYSFTVRAKDAAGNVSVASNTVNVTTLAPVVDTTAPTAPTLTASGTTSSSTNLSWSGATDNVGVTGYDVYQDGALLGSTASTTYAVTGLNPTTAYAFTVKAKDAAGNVSVASNTVNVTTLAVTLTYCTSQGNSIADEYIGRVQIGSIDNVSGGVTGYVDYTSLSTDLTKGDAATITITPTWTGTTYSEGYAVFIDYNQDGDFADAGETVWTKATSTATPAVGTFTVPATALSGPTRMRVSMKYNGTPTSCETFSYGQVEDYTVNLVAAVADTTPPTAPTLTASGTTETTTDLSWSGATDNVGVTGYDVYRGATLLGSTASTTYAVTGLTPSTTYSFTVRAKDAAGNVSAASNTVNVTTASPAGDTTPPSAPTNLTASGTTQTTTSLSWNASTDNVGVTGYEVFLGGSSIGTVTSTSANITGLTAATAYSFTVRAFDAAGNNSAMSNVANVTTLPVATVTYCTSQGNNSADEYINRVQLGTINNTSGNNGGYADFTSMSTNLVRGTSNSITITPGWTGSAFNEAYRVWIDYNQDGDFADSGEQVVNVTKTKTTPIARSFTVPTSALLGATRMRVSMKYNASPSYCEAFSYGEVEDYTVVITSSARIDDNSTFSFSLYPNPVKGDILNIGNLEGAATYRIFNMIGQELGNGKLENNNVSVGNLKAGAYLIEITTNNQTATKRFIKE